MQTELDTILAGLRANIHQETLNHRGPDAGLVTSFAVNLRRHGERINEKLSNLRARSEAAPHLTAIDAAAGTAATLVNDAIAAAEAAGRVEFAA
ncbi:hypothetical protein BwSF12_47230 [Bradyrhizobium ottawaense]|uniref:hypothetical protein n=1 Tax=Bradyrhizobium ottawaense TaxID=931866 RepID=UPI0027D61E7B|nr:hypothetical protein BwSH14_43690 [Bradyrhizobium ottawaense]GMO43341.1 hypothetical protein BwSF12_47230 [Bradyrhizobium ottawaense]GMO77743.1 hypothetical protein BwSF19_25050 [Bradyrhizobium ottawaense]GMO87625.1 hypothetical protein BwSH17_72260 [Bradyrhizobium ottawaense]